MTFLRTALIALLLFLPLHAQPAITASDAWIAEPVDGAASAYLTIHNPTMYDIYVVSATSNAAGKIELRDSGKTVKNLTVPAYGWLELKPDGPHLRLVDLKKMPQVGTTVDLTIETDGGVTMKVSGPVKKP